MKTRVVLATVPLLLLGATPASAQVTIGFGAGVGPGWYGAGPYGNRLYPYPYGRTIPWGYTGLAGGPYTAFPFVGWPGYTGAFGSFWTNGLSLYGPPVPTYGPLPGVLGNSDFVNQWRAAPTLGGGVGVYGWVGPFRASPRYRNPSVNVQPVLERFADEGEPKIVANDAEAGQPLYLSVKVPQPAAEIFVDGMKTAMTGTDRLFESPPLAGDKEYGYEIVARWKEGGATVERKKSVKGKPGEVIRIDLTQ